jgi:ketosteroid isomerase-like protein
MSIDMKTGTAENDQISGLIKSLSAAWRENQFDRLDPLFDDKVVFQDSEGHRLAEGKAACIQSYRDFIAIAKVLSYEEESPDMVWVAGVTIANYRWRIDYEMNGTNFHDEGRDWLALEKQGGTWRVTWRLMVPSAAPPPGRENDK